MNLFEYFLNIFQSGPERIFNSQFWISISNTGSFISLWLSLILAIGIIIVSIKSFRLESAISRFYGYLKSPQVASEKFSKSWARVQKRMQGGDEASMKLAIIEADHLLSGLLEQMGYDGETVAEKLRQIPANDPLIKNPEDLWRAHRVRNEIVHNPAYQISREETAIILNIFEKAFKDMLLTS